MSTLRAIACLSCLLAWAGVATADNAEDELVHRGVELRRAGSNAEALAEFQRAYELGHSPRSRAQIALAEQALGQWVEAEADLVAALASESDAWMQRNRDTLALALETIRDHLGTLAIESNVEGATISIDGRIVGRSPLAAPLRVAVGTVAITVEAAGYGPVERTIEIPSRAEVKAAIVVLPLPKTAPRAAAADAHAATLPPPATAAKPEAGRARTNAPSEGRAGSPALGWTLVGGGAALLAGAVVAHAVREHSARVFDDDSRCFYGALTRDQRCGGYHDRANMAGVLAIVGYAGGAVALTAGSLLLLTGGSSEVRSSGLDARVGPGLAYVSWAGGF